jgi:hypothetical protein
MDWQKCLAPRYKHVFGDAVEFISTRTIPGGSRAFAQWVYEEEHGSGAMLNAVYTFLAGEPNGISALALVKETRNGEILAHPLLVAVYSARQSPMGFVDVLTHASGIMPSPSDDLVANLTMRNAQLTRDRTRLIADLDKARADLETARVAFAAPIERPGRLTRLWKCLCTG